LEQKAEALEQRVSTLQMALRQCAEVASRWKRFRRELTAAIAVLMLAIGFTLGVYREPINEFVAGLGHAVGLGRHGDDPYLAYQNGHYAIAQRRAAPLAAAGDARAQTVLGLISYFGRGVPLDQNEALKWFRRAADQGDPIAQFYLGVMYSKGQSVPLDYAEASKWFRLAADQGYADAQYSLGVSYARGEIGAADNVSAYMWFDLAAARFPEGDGGRKTATTSRDLVANKMSRDEIAEAQKRAREWKPN
jgi:TPR repeat protein